MGGDGFGNDRPITLELGCGKGEYTVGLARRHPDRNFIGVDIKGHRFWRGAKTSSEEGLDNVAFLRTKIEFVQNFFAEGEVAEVWLTFSDPQPKDEKGTKRITSEVFLKRYQQFMVPGGLIHVKSDSELLYALSKEGGWRLASPSWRTARTFTGTWCTVWTMISPTSSASAPTTNRGGSKKARRSTTRTRA